MNEKALQIFQVSNLLRNVLHAIVRYIQSSQLLQVSNVLRNLNYFVI